MNSIGWAVKEMKNGAQVCRAGWNGKGMFIYYVPEAVYKAQTDVARAHFGESVPYRAYVAMRTVDNDVVPWLCSQSDLLAMDWEISK